MYYTCKTLFINTRDKTERKIQKEYVTFFIEMQQSIPT